MYLYYKNGFVYFISFYLSLFTCTQAISSPVSSLEYFLHSFRLNRYIFLHTNTKFSIKLVSSYFHHLPPPNVDVQLFILFRINGKMDKVQSCHC